PALLWKGYITQPAVIPDNSVQTLHCSPCICSFRGTARNAVFIFSWYSLHHERKYPHSLPVPPEKAGSSVSSACSCVVRLATKFCFACSFASVAGALLFMGASQFVAIAVRLQLLRWWAQHWLRMPLAHRLLRLDQAPFPATGTLLRSRHRVRDG